LHRSRSTSLDDVGQGAFPSYLFFAWLHPSWQVSTDCLFESNAGRIRVQQDLRVPGFDIDVTALFRDDIQQPGAAVTVSLANDIQVVSGLVAHTTSVRRNPRLCSIEPDEVLCDLVPKVQINRRDLIACRLDGRRVRHDRTLITIEHRQVDIEAKNNVVESLAYRCKVSCCVEGSLRKAKVRTLVTAEDAGVWFSFCPIGTKFCTCQFFVRPLEGQVGSMIHRQLQKLFPVVVLGSKFKSP